MLEKFERRDFLEALFEGYYSLGGNFIIVKSADRPEGHGRISFFPNIESLSTARFSDQMHVFFGVCPREKMKSGKEHVRFVTCLWAGIDIGPDGFSGKNCPFQGGPMAMQAVEDFPLKPSIIVRSGRGLHLYWLLKEVKEISEPTALETILNRLNSHFGCQTPIGVDSMLRLPGTANSRGNTDDGKCQIEHLDPGIRYLGREFQVLERLQPYVAAPPPKPAAPPDLAPPPPQMATVTPPDLEVETEVISEVLEVMDDQDSNVSGGGTDQLADRIVARLGQELMDRFADKIADRIAERSADMIAQKIVARLRAK